MTKTLGERDFSAQETMHLLLSLKLHSSSFQVLPVNLDGTRSLKKVKDPNSKVSETFSDRKFLFKTQVFDCQSAVFDR